MFKKKSNIFNNESSFIDFVYELEELLSSIDLYTYRFKDNRIINPKVLVLILKIVNNCRNLDEIIRWIKMIHISYDSKVPEDLFISVIYSDKYLIKNISKSPNILNLNFDSNKLLTKIQICIKCDTHLYHAVFPIEKTNVYSVNGRAFAFTKVIDGNFELQDFYTALYYKNKMINNRLCITKNGIQYFFNKNVFYDIKL